MLEHKMCAINADHLPEESPLQFCALPQLLHEDETALCTDSLAFAQPGKWSRIHAVYAGMTIANRSRCETTQRGALAMTASRV